MKLSGYRLDGAGAASPLAEGRELKYKREEQECPAQGVAPRGGAGIEIRRTTPPPRTRKSPLAEGRELK